MSKNSIQVSAFKARCIEAMREVDRTGKSLVVTLRGVPLVVVGPAPRERRLGTMQGECEIAVDLVKLDFTHEWEMGK